MRGSSPRIKNLEARRLAELLHHIQRFGGRARESWIKKDIQACEICKALRFQNPKTIHQYLKKAVQLGWLRHHKDLAHKLSIYEISEEKRLRFSLILDLYHDHWREFVHARKLGKFLEYSDDPEQLIEELKSFTILKWCRVLKRMLMAKSSKYMEDLFRRNKSLMDIAWWIFHWLSQKPQEEREELRKHLLAAVMNEEQRQLFKLSVMTWKRPYEQIIQMAEKGEWPKNKNRGS